MLDDVFICKGVMVGDYIALVNVTNFYFAVKKDISSNAATKP